MASTIELLEAIGGDASLRHASEPALIAALVGMGASEGLRVAAATGDEAQLRREFGSRLTQPMRVNKNPINGGCDPDDEDGTEEDVPDNGDGDEDAEAHPDA